MDVDIGARRVALSASGSLLQGGNVLTVTLADVWGLGESRVQLILKFIGAASEQSVVATIVSPQVACVKVPAWAKPEEVTVQVLIATTCEEPGDVGGTSSAGISADGRRTETIVAVVPFSYLSDPAFDAAHYLLSNVDDDCCLSNIQCLRQLGFSNGDHYAADLLLTRAFAQLPLPEGWSVLGTHHIGVREPRETILHMAARLGLSSFVEHLVTSTPGGREAAFVTNKDGLLPSDVARSMSRAEIAELIDRCRDQTVSLTNGELPTIELTGNCMDAPNSTSVVFPDIAHEVRRVCDRLQSASLQSAGNMYSHTPIPTKSSESAEVNTDAGLHTDCRTTHPQGDTTVVVSEPLSRSISEVQASIRSLEGYRHKISDARTLRKDQLSRYSTSCPSLDCSWADGAAAGRYRSMLTVPKEEEEDIAASADSPKLRGESVRGHDRPRSLDSLGSALRGSPAIVSVINLTGVTQDSTAVGSEGELGNDGDSCSSAATVEQLRQVSRNMFGGAKQQKSRFHLGMLTVESRSFSLGSLGSEDEGESQGQSPNAITADDVQNIPAQDVLLLRRSGETSVPAVQARPQSYGGSATRLPISKTLVGLGAQPDADDLGSSQVVRFRAATALQASTNLNKSKSVSTPSIRSDLSGDHARLLSEASFTNCDAVVEEDSDAQARDRRLSERRSSLFTYPTAFPDDDVRKKQSGARRLSMAFSKLGSQRKSKDVRRPLHTFIPVSSSSATCDVCERALTSGVSSKTVYQCSCCLINTHDECRGRAVPCTKTKVTRKTGSLVPPLLRHVRSAHSFRVASTPLPHSPTSVSYGSLQQLSENSRPLNSVNTMAGMMTKTTGQDLQESVMTTVQENISASVDSLPDSAGNEEFEEDPELVHIGPSPEPESWSDTVDKKLLKKLNAKYIQRQDNIFEFIATEKQYVRTLKMVQKVFVNGMIKQCKYSDKDIEKFFPGIANLLDIHATFLGRLQKRQDEKVDKSIDFVGDIILEQFDDLMGERMKEAYGRFVSRQREAVEHYKNKLKTDRAFQELVKKCSANPNTRRRGIQDLITIVTQRMTKYKTLLEQIIKNTKDAKDKVDRENLTRALECNKRILEHIDEAIETRSKELRLIEIYTRMDVRAVTSYDKTKTFKKSDFLAKGRKLRHEGVVAWRNAREKEVETLIVLLSDVVVFLQDNPQKYTFFSQDNKASVIPLSKLLVREKGSTKDNRGIYLIRQSRDDPEMIELVCRSAAERREWIEELRKAVHDCPEEDETASNETAEEGREALEKLAKVNELVESLKAKDEELESLCKQRCQLLNDLLTAYGHADVCDQIQCGYNEDGEFFQAVDLIKFALTEVSRLSSTYVALPPLSPTGGSLGRSWSSVGEHQTPGNHVAPIPKRSDTFAGFEQGGKALTGSIGRQRSATSHSTSLHGSSVSSQELSPHDGDCGFREPYGIDVRDSSGSIKKMLTGAAAAGQQLQQPQPADRSSASLMQLIGASSGSTGSSQQLDLAGLSAAGGGHGESLVALSNIASITALIPPSREQLVCLGQLSEYLQALLLITNKQDTTIESYKQQLAEALLRMNKLNLEVEKVSTEKRNAFRHNKQMEEIRNLHELVSKERQQMEADKEKWRHRQNDEQRRLDELRLECEHQQEELKRERDELQRQREVLQKQIDFHTTVQGRAAGTTHPTMRNSVRPTETSGRSVASANGSGDGSSTARLRCEIPSETVGASVMHSRSRSVDVSVPAAAAAGGHHSAAALPSHSESPLAVLTTDDVVQSGVAGVGARDRPSLAGTSSSPSQSGAPGSHLRPRSAQSSTTASTVHIQQQYQQQSGNQIAHLPLPPHRAAAGGSAPPLPEVAVHPTASGLDGIHVKTMPGASLPAAKQDSQEIIYF